MPAPGTINLVANNGLYCTGALLPEFESLVINRPGAGIIGIAVGFGGQYLVKDLISGFFILLENQYRVGDVVCFGDKAIISASPKMITWCEEKLLNRDAAWLFEYSKLRGIDKKLNEFGHEIADIHHYYLPNTDVPLIEPNISVKWYETEEILQEYKSIREQGNVISYCEVSSYAIGVGIPVFNSKGQIKACVAVSFTRLSTKKGDMKKIEDIINILNLYSKEFSKYIP